MGAEAVSLSVGSLRLAHLHSFCGNKGPQTTDCALGRLACSNGAEYAEIRMFRANVRLGLKKIQLVYPELKLELTSDCMTVLPSRSAITPTAFIALR